MKSIMQQDKQCYICGSTRNLELHHIIHGTANRKKAEELGLWLWLCPEHHRGKDSPHFDANIDRWFKGLAQQRFEKTHSREEWMKAAGRNYLE